MIHTSKTILLTKGMKRLAVLLFIFLACSALNAQTVPPQFISYQAVAHESDGTLLINQDIVVRIEILEGAGASNLLWSESHDVLTNDYGLFTLNIGEGTSTTLGSLNSFSDIDWGAGQYYLRVQVDFDPGSGLVDMGTIRLTSVPYALYCDSTRAAPYFGIEQLLDVDLTGLTTNSILKYDGTQWIISVDSSGYYSGGSYISIGTGNDINLDVAMSGDLDGSYPSPTVKGIDGIQVSTTGISPGDVLVYDGAQWVPTTDSVNLYKGGGSITVTNNVINLDPLMSGDLDGTYPNPQVSGILGMPVDVSLGLTDGKILKFNNTLSRWELRPDTGAIYIAGTGISITPAPGGDIINNSFQNLSQLTNDVGFITGEVDGDITNELQDLLFTGDTLYITGGSGISLSKFADSLSPNIYLSRVINDIGFLQTEIDGDITNELQDLSFTGDTLYISGGSGISLSKFADSLSPNIYLSRVINDIGFLQTEIDGDITNELQDLSFTGDTLYISGGSGISLSKFADSLSPNIYLSRVINDIGFLQTEIDGDITNELQDLSFTGDTLYISGGSGISLSKFADSLSPNMVLDVCIMAVIFI